MFQFEKDIAYFYGAKNPEKISEHYIKAIQEFEKLGPGANNDLLKQTMFNRLKEAYAEVRAQTSLQFDTEKAAQYEFKLILAQAKAAPFENIYQIMLDLYHEVFQSDALAIHKGAMLRTFLYKYKIGLLKRSDKLSNDDQIFMRSIARESERELNNVCLAEASKR